MFFARAATLQAIHRHRAGVQSRAQRDTLGEAEAQEGPMTLQIYVDTSKKVGNPDHLEAFATTDAAETGFEENDPEGVEGLICSIDPLPGHCLCAPARAESRAVTRMTKCPSLVIHKASPYRTATHEQSAFG
jgi:hypothetical protein